MQNLRQDLKYAIRVLVKNPGFTLIAVLILALGIGASSAIFSVVDAVLLRPLPYPHPDRLVTVWEKEADGSRHRLADPNFLDFRSQNHSLEGLATFYSGPESVSGGSEPVRVNIGLVSHDFFTVMGVEPFRGREFSADESRLHGTPAMIVSYGYWQEYLGGAADFSRVHLSMNGQSYSIVGVMPQGFDFASANIAIWVPREPYGWSTSRSSHNSEGIARLRDGVTLEQARADLGTMARRINAQYAKIENPDYFLTDASVIPLADFVVENVRPALIALFGAVVLLFLVACANVAGLLLARTSGRRKELAVRAALGAGRRRLVEQLLAESLILAVIGGTVGTLLAMWTTQLLPSILPANLPRQQTIAISGTVLLFTLTLTLAVAIGLGFFAAWRAGEVDLADALSAGSRGYSSASQKARSSLVIAEIAATLVLLVSAGLLGRSFMSLVSVTPGFSGHNLLLLKFSLSQPSGDLTPQQKQAEIARQTQFLDSALERVEAIPGVEAAAAAGALPVADGEGFNDGTFLILNGHAAPTNFDDWGRMAKTVPTGQADRAVASAGFFATTGIPLLQGRMFGPQDGPDAPNIALISQNLARQRWPKQNPLGQVIDFSNMDGILKPLTIVGIVGDVRAEGLDKPMTPMVYVDYRQRGMGNGSPAIIMRTALPAAAIVPAARSIFHDLNPDIPVEFSTYAQALGGWTAQKRFLFLLAGVFAAVALTLAAVGLYGLLSYSVARRTQEIGVRVALGAQRNDVLRLVLGEGARLALFGVILGIGTSLAITRLMSSLLFGVGSTDPLTYVTVAVLLSVVALLASYVPARRAVRVDPIVALRYE